MKIIRVLPALLLAAFLSSCCEPAQKNSFPQVIDSTYSDTAVKDADIFFQGDTVVNVLDSIFYPVYSVNIKNIGTQGDTFYLSYSRFRNGIEIPISITQYVNAGETKTFKTQGPLPSNSPDTLREKFYSFFVQSPDSIHISTLMPQISIHYGQTPNGSEQCGSPGRDTSVNPLSLKHK